MSGEQLSVSFRRTSMTQKSNQELLEEFQKIVYESRVTKHMKWYGQAHSVYMEEHGDEELQKWQQEGVAIKDTFRFCISVYESWYEDADLYESHSLQDSFVSLAREFAKDNWLHYYSQGFPTEWFETETRPDLEEKSVVWLKKQLPRHTKVNLKPKGSIDGVLIAKVIPFDSNIDISEKYINQGLATNKC